MLIAINTMNVVIDKKTGAFIDTVDRMDRRDLIAYLAEIGSNASRLKKFKTETLKAMARKEYFDSSRLCLENVIKTKEQGRRANKMVDAVGFSIYS